jgi:hypothetical protein
MEMTLADRRILLAALVEIKELHSELYATNNPNLANALRWSIFDRAERLNNGHYADPDSRGTLPHTN